MANLYNCINQLLSEYVLFLFEMQAVIKAALKAFDHQRGGTGSRAALRCSFSLSVILAGLSHDKESFH